MIGERISHYRVEYEIGRGGMGTVYAGTYEGLQRRAAIKILKPEYATQPHLLARFFNEARAANIVDHPNVVTIFEHGSLPNGTVFYIMEFLDGVSLTQRRPEHPIRPEPWIFRFMRQIATGLAAAHKRGVIHRDLKPDNVMLVADSETPGGERAKIIDFGIAKLLSEASSEHAQEGADSLTRPDTFLGTPRYLSPEQSRDASRVTDKTDVYSLGVMLYEFLAGRPPFQAKNVLELVVKHRSDTPESLRHRNPMVDETIERLVMSMLAKEPSRRPSMMEVVKILEAYETPRPTWEPTIPDLTEFEPEPIAEARQAEKNDKVEIHRYSIGDVATRLSTVSKRTYYKYGRRVIAALLMLMSLMFASLLIILHARKDTKTSVATIPYSPHPHSPDPLKSIMTNATKLGTPIANRTEMNHEVQPQAIISDSISYPGRENPGPIESVAALPKLMDNRIKRSVHVKSANAKVTLEIKNKREGIPEHKAQIETKDGTPGSPQEMSDKVPPRTSPSVGNPGSHTSNTRMQESDPAKGPASQSIPQNENPTKALRRGTVVVDN